MFMIDLKSAAVKIEQAAQWDFQNKATRTSPPWLAFVLEVPLRNLRPSMCDFVPCDQIVQEAYFSHFCYTLQKSFNFLHRRSIIHPTHFFNFLCPRRFRHQLCSNREIVFLRRVEQTPPIKLSTNYFWKQNATTLWCLRAWLHTMFQIMDTL